MSRFGSYEEMLAEEKHGPYDFTKDGRCSGCGECCSNFLPLSTKEISKIERFIKRHDVKEQHCNFPVTQNALDMTCPFRSNSERKCLIYPVRPEICRVFQCNQPKELIDKNKELIHGIRRAVDMRQVFYGHSCGFDKLIEVLLNGK